MIRIKDISRVDYSLKAYSLDLLVDNIDCNRSTDKDFFLLFDAINCEIRELIKKAI